jgi:VWFA-related protein
MTMVGYTLAALFLAQASAIAPDAEVRALTVTVLDKEGAPVAGLREQDVAITENGVVRDITSFKPDERPLTVAVIVDSSRPVATDFRMHAIPAVSSFISRLPEGTRYAVWTTGDRPTKILDYTEEPAVASKALHNVAPLGGNYMLDALVEASEDLKSNVREGDRTVVVALSGTGPELSYVDRWRAAEEAVENADLFLSLQVDVGGANFQMRANLSYVLEKLAESTGGEYDVILSYMGTDRALRKLSPFLRAGYRLAYATVPDLKKRDLEVEVAQPGTEVRLPVRTEETSELELDS